MNNVAEQVVRLKGVTKTYGSVHAVNGIDMEIRHGEIVALLGPNGAGKTTTISMMLGLLLPTTGTIEMFDMSPIGAIRQAVLVQCSGRKVDVGGSHRRIHRFCAQPAPRAVA